jgi:hypothetical protein
VCGCAEVRSPAARAETYAQALEVGDLRRAHAQLSADSVGLEALEARYPDERSRRLRAAEVRAGIATLKAEAPGLTVVHGPEGWQVVERAPSPSTPPATEGHTPAAALEAFLDASEQGDFTAAWHWLSGAWRARYTPEQLAGDFRSEPRARDRLVRARLALASAPVRISASEWHFPVSGMLAVRLILEDAGWRVAALE